MPAISPKMRRAGAPVDISRIVAHGSNVVAGGESGRENEDPQDIGATRPVRQADATISIGAPHPSPAKPREPVEAELPSGTVTFLFTDIEGSTRLWETESAAMARSLVLHNEMLYAAFDHHGGLPFSTMGDGMAVAFSSAVGAARAALGA